MLKRILALFEREIDPLDVYRVDHLAGRKVDLLRFPQKARVDGEGLYAYRLCFSVSDQDADRVRSAIATQFLIPSDGRYFSISVTNSRGHSIHGEIRAEFNGAVVELLTNCVDLLYTLDGHQLRTIAPWKAFPELDPRSIGALQGSIEFWWSQYWMPYWAALSEAQQLRYLKSAPLEWAEFITLHIPRSCDTRSF